MTTKTPAEIAAMQDLIDRGELPRDAIKKHFDDEDAAVYGFDAKKDRKGKRQQQGIGAPGHETGNHFAAIRRYEGEEAYREAVMDLWKRNPKGAERLGLPKFKDKAA